MHPKVFNALHTNNKEELEELYKVWADNYDHDVVKVIGYVGHSITTELLMKYVDNSKAKILDAGCGTGLVGEVLHERKFKNIVGIDFSQTMLDQALKKNVYQSLALSDLTEKLAFKDNTFDAIVSAGTFTCGHVGPEAFSELIRVTKTGGYISFTVRDQEWNRLPYEKTIRELEEKNLWLCMESFITDYNIAEGVTCQLCLYKVTA
jgi:predicted TPR repeat methyltransferase